MIRKEKITDFVAYPDQPARDVYPVRLVWNDYYERPC